MTSNSLLRACLGAALAMSASLAIAADPPRVPLNPSEPVPAAIPKSEPPPPPGPAMFSPSGPNPASMPPPSPGAVPGPMPAAALPANTPIGGPALVQPANASTPLSADQAVVESPINASPTVAPSLDEKARWCAAAAENGLETKDCKARAK